MHVPKGRGATTGEGMDVCTNLPFPRSVVNGCPEIRKPGNLYSRQTNAWRETGVSLIQHLEQRASRTGARFGRIAKRDQLP